MRTPRYQKDETSSREEPLREKRGREEKLDEDFKEENMYLVLDTLTVSECEEIQEETESMLD